MSEVSIVYLSDKDIRTYAMPMDSETLSAFEDPSTFIESEDSYTKDLVIRNLKDKLEWIIEQNDGQDKSKLIRLKQMLESEDNESVVLALELMNLIINK